MSVTTTETDTPDYESFVGKRVRLVYVPDAPDGGTEQPPAEEVIAFVEAYNPSLGVLMPRQKGRTLGFLVTTQNVIEIELDDEPSRIVKQKRLRPVDLSQVRQHLADRHGVDVPKLNAMTDEQAEEEHDLIDHTNLGHYHTDPNGDTEDSTSITDAAQASE